MIDIAHNSPGPRRLALRAPTKGTAVLGGALALLVGVAYCLPSFPSGSIDPGVLLLAGSSGTSTGASSPETGSVSAVYANHANWNDYIQNDGTGRTDATGTACTGTTTGGYSRCIHSGLLRAVPVTNRTSCSGLSASDSASALLWTCDSSSGSIRMVSTGFIPGRGLHDLIDFSAGAWKSMSVTVSDAAGSTTTEASQWWSNTIVLNHQPGTAINLTTPGNVYAYSTSPGGDFSITGDKISVVSDQSVTMQGAGGGGNLIFANGANYLWIEPGRMQATNQNTAVLLQSTHYSVLYLAQAQLAMTTSGIRLQASHNNLLYYIFSSNNQAGSAISLNSSNYNTLSQLYLSNAADNGLEILSSHSNTISNVLSANNQSRGLLIDGSNNNALANITSANNGSVNITLRSNSIQNTLLSMALANSASGLATDATAHQNSFIHTASAHAGTAFNINSNYNFFAGVFRVGSTTTTNCAGGGTAGVSGTPCMQNQASMFTAQPGADFSSSFAGKIATDDATNGSDSTGSRLVGSITDWLNFDSVFRLWGPQGAGAFLANDQRFRCTSGTCHIYDWRLLSSDGLLRNNLSIPDGNVAFAHIWNTTNQTECETISRAVWTTNVCSYPGFSSSASCTGAGGDYASSKCVSVFLGNAYEFIGDGYGNDNGLCESYELCVYSPNIGAYQGEGSFTDLGAITDGTVQGVYLIQLSTNGQ